MHELFFMGMEPENHPHASKIDNRSTIIYADQFALNFDKFAWWEDWKNRIDITWLLKHSKYYLVSSWMNQVCHLYQRIRRGFGVADPRTENVRFETPKELRNFGHFSMEQSGILLMISSRSFSLLANNISSAKLRWLRYLQFRSKPFFESIFIYARTCLPKELWIV